MKLLVTGRTGQVATSLVERAQCLLDVELLSAGRPDLDLAVSGSAKALIDAIRLDPWRRSPWVRRQAGRTVIMAATTRGLTFGKWKWQEGASGPQPRKRPRRKREQRPKIKRRSS